MIRSRRNQKNPGKRRKVGARLTLVLIVLSLLVGSVVQAHGQSDSGSSTTVSTDLDLSWWSVDGGGVTALTGGNGYTLGGTIGQPDASVWSNATYRLTGGFWAGTVWEDLYLFLPLLLRDFP